MEHYLVLPYSEGPMNEEDAKCYSTGEHRIFPCGKCSSEKRQVYHNVFGPHRHQAREV
jgi:hypothetical protein